MIYRDNTVASAAPVANEAVPHNALLVVIGRKSLVNDEPSQKWVFADGEVGDAAGSTSPYSYDELIDT